MATSTRNAGVPVPWPTRCMNGGQQASTAKPRTNAARSNLWRVIAGVWAFSRETMGQQQGSRLLLKLRGLPPPFIQLKIQGLLRDAVFFACMLCQNEISDFWTTPTELFSQFPFCLH